MKINKSKKRLAIISTLLTVVVALILAISLGVINNHNNPVIAKVNGQKIRKNEIESKLNTMFASGSTPEIEKLPPEVIEILAKDIYVEKELDKRIKKSKIIKDEEVQNKLKDFTKKVTRQAYLESIIKEKITEKTVRDRYVELVNEIAGKREMHLRYIVTKTEKEAEIAKAAALSTGFANAAKKYSIDQSTASNGGDLGYVLENNLGQEFYNIITSLKKGQISKPIQTKFGWNIFKVEDIRDAKADSFDDVRAALEEEMKKEAVKKVFSEIADSAKVKILVKTEDLSDKGENKIRIENEKPATQK